MNINEISELKNAPHLIFLRKNEAFFSQSLVPFQKVEHNDSLWLHQTKSLIFDRPHYVSFCVDICVEPQQRHSSQRNCLQRFGVKAEISAVIASV